MSITTTNSWGYLQSNGTYNGLIGALMQNKTDIGGSAGFLQKGLISYLDATIGVWKYR